MQIVHEVPRTGRVMRRPHHQFQLRQQPFQIQPFVIAPVLPGETLKNALMQARVVTDPIKNPLIGWWMEYYLFYCTHRSLPNSAVWQNMVLDPSTTTTAQKVGAKQEHYHGPTSIDFVAECLQAIVADFFREQGETWNGNMVGNLPACRIAQDSWLDSMFDETIIPEGGDPQTTPDNMESLDRMRLQYELLQSMKLTEMTYEDFLATYGVRQQTVRVNKPELIRYVKEWSYPSNTVNPTTGAPSSAVSWGIAERSDKDRFFKEPGFIFGVSVARPKVYLSRQIGAVANYMNDAYAWLPAILRDDPATSLKAFTGVGGSEGPISSSVNGYWVDLRDLLLYGDQFVNFALTETDAGFVAMPTTALQKRYPALTDVEALFVDAAGGKKYVRQDGVINFSILGTQVDQT